MSIRDMLNGKTADAEAELEAARAERRDAVASRDARQKRKAELIASLGELNKQLDAVAESDDEKQLSKLQADYDETEKKVREIDRLLNGAVNRIAEADTKIRRATAGTTLKVFAKLVGKRHRNTKALQAALHDTAEMFAALIASNDDIAQQCAVQNFSVPYDAAVYPRELFALIERELTRLNPLLPGATRLQGDPREMRTFAEEMEHRDKYFLDFIANEGKQIAVHEPAEGVIQELPATLTGELAPPELALPEGAVVNLSQAMAMMPRPRVNLGELSDD